MNSGLPFHRNQDAVTPDPDPGNRVWGVGLGLSLTAGGAYLAYTHNARVLVAHTQASAPPPKHDERLPAYMLEGLGILVLGVAAVREIVRHCRGPGAS